MGSDTACLQVCVDVRYLKYWVILRRCGVGGLVNVGSDTTCLQVCVDVRYLKSWVILRRCGVGGLV